MEVVVCWSICERKGIWGNELERRVGGGWIYIRAGGLLINVFFFFFLINKIK